MPNDLRWLFCNLCSPCKLEGSQEAEPGMSQALDELLEDSKADEKVAEKEAAQSVDERMPIEKDKAAQPSDTDMQDQAAEDRKAEEETRQEQKVGPPEVPEGLRRSCSFYDS